MTRSAATTLGGRLTLRLSDRHGIDAVVLSGHVRTAVAGNLRPVGVQDVSVVVITLQPYHTFALNRLVGVNVGAGFVLAVANAPDNPSLGVDGWKHGLAISSALRVSIIPPLSLEISGSASRYLRSAGQMHVAWSAGLAYVFPRGQAQ